MSPEYVSTRVGFREGLVQLAEKRPDIVFVSTDSLKVVKGEPFLQRWPDRVIEVGIAEQNGVAISAGLAAAGLKPYLCTYAGFLTMRACEQMRTFVAYPRQQVRFVGVNAGLFGGNREGVSHQFIEDIGILRTIPGFTILCPADGDQVRQAVLASVDLDGPVYIRAGSGREERVFPDGTPFEIGKIRILKEYGSDLALFCHGFVVNRALAAADSLAARGIKATVVEVHTLKPLDVDGIAGVLGRCGRALSVEDHNVIGGLGSALAEVIAEGCPARL
ncbi:MAG TPA: transketolase C-terminal domain-containing protein, partial [Rectinemataceae bacterium]